MGHLSLHDHVSPFLIIYLFVSIYLPTYFQLVLFLSRILANAAPKYTPIISTMLHCIKQSMSTPPQAWAPQSRFKEEERDSNSFLYFKIKSLFHFLDIYQLLKNLYFNEL